jgi:hypothetical protein
VEAAPSIRQPQPARVAPLPVLSANDRWVPEVDRRGRALVGSDDWDLFKSSTNAANCHLLADFANELSRLRALTGRLTADIIDRTLGGAPPIVRKVVRRCVDRIVDTHLGGIPEVVRAVRTVGIFLCVVNGRPLTDCPCLVGWWRSDGRKAMKTALKDALPPA